MELVVREDAGWGHHVSHGRAGDRDGDDVRGVTSPYVYVRTLFFRFFTSRNGANFKLHLYNLLGLVRSRMFILFIFHLLYFLGLRNATSLFTFRPLVHFLIEF